MRYTKFVESTMKLIFEPTIHWERKWQKKSVVFDSFIDFYKNDRKLTEIFVDKIYYCQNRQSAKTDKKDFCHLLSLMTDFCW